MEKSVEKISNNDASSFNEGGGKTNGAVHCLLLYYTGTFNTRYITQKLKARLEQEGWQITTYEINPLNNEALDYSPYDIVGLGSPIYGFAAPYAFLRFIRAQKFPAGMRAFIYKNSGETYHANDASSKYFLRKLRRDKVIVENEYHFVMPYNIHFRFEDACIREMLEMDRKLMEILVYEVTHRIPNWKPYKLWPRFVSSVVARPQYIGGNVNSFLYKVDKKKCINCDLCIKRCPTQNIYRNKKGEIAFHHHCLMCMRCSFYCPADAFDIGFLEDWGWHVNIKGGYDFERIEKMPLKPFITPDTKGFFKCYVEKYEKINERYEEIMKAK
ncbi:MAG: EFR1 family ferrodoxin [Bacteroidaceae bacterium]|nr:EFR1 family ferrodoxin [Bacteroidaceae bacterium]